MTVPAHITMDFARQDDCLDKMVPSDLRLLLGHIEELERENAQLSKALGIADPKELAEMILRQQRALAAEQG